MASCPDCKKGSILPGEPTGRMVNGAYFAAGPSENDSRAIILLTDIFGLALVNSKLLADHFSKCLSADVWIPDMFDGSPPFPVDKMGTPQRAGEKMNWIPYFFGLIPNLPALFRNRPSITSTRLRSFIATLQTEKNYKKLGAVGYCYGGAMAVKLASTDLFNSVVICHPGPVSEQEISAIKVPSSFVCAEEDITFGPKARKKAEEIFASRNGRDNFIEHEFKVYKGTTHGFAVRPNQSYPEVKAGYEAALEQTVQWFEKTLPI
ncbi:dienelactone hydrolase endo-1,3,1,4-beta-D-glucanase [Gymnopus androsaceus JB14]|uniref:Dienelactone hydrolase endo-1,3,1,4-beta-D-glucanase n=1 Tax=Gymnopus androsaceus JB14 TaxID=1447944 RepID=A0A6A4I265_9AGAR|nr:dienelactone hydrolase endo-1,3,1,4-beta-D-glucanase [Gymnopus androsaceus JB14]